MTRPDDTTDNAEPNIDDSTDGRAERIAESVRSQLDAASSSRRSFLGRSAVAGGALLAMGSGAGVAQDDEEPEEEADGPMFDDVRGTDVDVLNYALALEHLEAAFYEEALDQLDEDDFMEADELADYSEEAREEIYEYVEVVGAHESTHVDVLTQAVALLGADPTPAAEYDFGVESVGDFLALGQVLENTGVAAYAGAAPFVESPDLLGVALSIHSVEARHAAIFNLLAGSSPFPDAFDEAASQDEVLDAVSQFIEGEADEDDEDAEDEEEEEEADDEEDEAEDEEEEEGADDEEDEETDADDEGEGSDEADGAGDEASDEADGEGTDSPGDEQSGGAGDDESGGEGTDDAGEDA
ncbi:ferritin-like domain-containing protein [Haloparvum sedimenti]|uniref:ferritin-like domain-containing protein n=1 Tax=Haloparvum sedimenti TaxID=1678448 RepID=UPI0009B5D16D|nr:ferritin-like domain-containing protein [Haloparvum sedimenti]